MAGFFDNLADFLEGLFSTDPQALKAKRQLREQTAVLEEVRPPVFSSKADQLLPGFALGWSQVHSLLLPLRDLFDKTLGHPDKKVRDQSLAFLVESVLSGEVADRRLALSYEALKDRMAQAGDPARELTAVNADFNSLLMDLRRQDSDKIQKDFEALFRLKSLAGHSLTSLLSRFGYDPASATQRFRAADAGSAVPDLLDLYFVTEGQDLGPGVEQLLGLLLERVGPQQAPENRRKIGAILQRFRDLVRGPCSPYLLLQLIRVAQRNLDAAPEVQRFSDRYVQVYAGNLSDRFLQDRDRVLREQNESSMEADIEALFPGTPLLTLSYYNSGTSDGLTDAGLPGLTSVKTLQLLKSFCFAVLKTGYLDSVKKVVLDGQFSEKEWGERLSDLLYAADEILGTIEAFDLSLESDQKSGLPALQKYLGTKVPASAVPRQLVEKMNRGAQAVLEKGSRTLGTLAQTVQEILNDYKLPQPKRVANIKGLGGKDQRALVESLIGGYNRTAQLLRILKHFVVIQ